jgi:hypothetical protein
VRPSETPRRSGRYTYMPHAPAKSKRNSRKTGRKPEFFRPRRAPRANAKPLRQSAESQPRMGSEG